jgi:hypothetical protein
VPLEIAEPARKKASAATGIPAAMTRTWPATPRSNYGIPSKPRRKPTSPSTALMPVG